MIFGFDLEELRKDFNYLKKHDPFFNFDSVEEWAEFLNEMGESDEK